MTKLLLLNGPNLNMLGKRQPEVYGTTTLSDIEAITKDHAESLGATLDCHQSNHEGALLDHIHGAHGIYDGIILNAGAYTHTSIALYDAIKAVGIPVVEIHISNIHAREEFRHHSCIAPVVIGSIAGFGVNSYTLGVDALIRDLRSRE